MKKATTAKRKTMVIPRLESPKKNAVNQSHVDFGSRKASTPTHDKPAKAESPNISCIMPTEISNNAIGKQAVFGKPTTSAPVLKKVTVVDKTQSLTEQIDYEYAYYLQTMFRRKLAEGEASEVHDTLTVLQKRIADNQNILQKTTERLKNINFNKDIETLDKLRNPNYGKVLESLNNANCKEYLDAVNRKLEQRQNQLRIKNIELPEGGSSELLKIMNDTVAACEKLKASNVLEVNKLRSEIKASNNSTSETLSRCFELIPEVENLTLDRASLEISSEYNSQLLTKQSNLELVPKIKNLNSDRASLEITDEFLQ